MNLKVKVTKKSEAVPVSGLGVGDYFVYAEALYMKVEPTMHEGSDGFVRGPRNAVRVALTSEAGGQLYWFPNDAAHYVMRAESVDIQATY